MKRELRKILLSALCLVLVPAAFASTTWYVNGVSGSDNNNCLSAATACKTIGHAISLASAGDSIRVAAATYRENLTINFSLRISGSGARTTIIDGGGAGTVVTINNYNSHTNVTLSGLTITDGAMGGIIARGVVTINNSSINANTTKGGLTGGAHGAGVYDDEGILVINDSTVSGNVAKGSLCQRNCTGAAGAGIYLFSYTKQASLTMNNSTVVGNDAVADAFASSGGGISGGGSISINNTTISGNSASSSGGISGNATVQNSIVAANTGGNCGGTFTSQGYNLSSDNTCNFNGPGDLNNIDPLLGPLQNKGGPTNTQALLSGSPAIDAGNPSGCTDGSGHLLKTDQRGQPRPDKEDIGGCDMGAYERQSD